MRDPGYEFPKTPQRVEKLHRVHYSAPDQGLKATFCRVLALF
jgi:hypothetical protein